jgi:hypothetical protein
MCMHGNMCRMFDGHVIEKIRHTIKKEFLGELPLGSAILLKTSHPKARFLLYSSAYQYNQSSKLPNIYTCLWTAFMTIYKYNEKKIKKYKKFRRESEDLTSVKKNLNIKFDLIKTVVFKG